MHGWEPESGAVGLCPAAFGPVRAAHRTVSVWKSVWSAVEPIGGALSWPPLPAQSRSGARAMEASWAARSDGDDP